MLQRFSSITILQELDETRRKKQTEITEIGESIENQFQAKLQKTLQDMRAQFDFQLSRNRKEVEDMYEGKVRRVYGSMSFFLAYSNEFQFLSLKS